MRGIRNQTREKFKSGIAERSLMNRIPSITMCAIMYKLALVLLSALALSACNKNPNTSSAAPKDAVEQKLQEIAGSNATNCGRFAVQTAEPQLKAASDCAMQSAQGKKPFYIGYDMPGMTVAVASSSDGKLYSVQVQERGTVSSEPCPSELRVAPSGRVSCYAPGTFGGGAMGSNPHGGAMMPPGGSGSTGGMMNPHDVIPPGESTPNPHQGTAKPPKKQ
jgi:hypothetical protein